MSVKVRDEVLPSPAAGLLQLARLQAGISQQELAERAGVDRTMISAYEHDRRQPTLPTLLKLLKAAGFELRMHLEPWDDHDDVLDARERQRPAAERKAWERRQKARLAALDPPKATKRTAKGAPER
jgi:transcriptional regulator with XRE-family HTH domain